MKAEGCIFVKPLGLAEAEARVRAAVNHVVNFFTDSCCIDTQPPLPPLPPGR